MRTNFLICLAFAFSFSYFPFSISAAAIGSLLFTSIPFRFPFFCSRFSIVSHPCVLLRLLFFFLWFVFILFTPFRPIWWKESLENCERKKKNKIRRRINKQFSRLIVCMWCRRNDTECTLSLSLCLSPTQPVKRPDKVTIVWCARECVSVRIKAHIQGMQSLSILWFDRIRCGSEFNIWMKCRASQYVYPFRGQK